VTPFVTGIEAVCRNARGTADRAPAAGGGEHEGALGLGIEQVRPRLLVQLQRLEVFEIVDADAGHGDLLMVVSDTGGWALHGRVPRELPGIN
jgi:hypothetical protein